MEPAPLPPILDPNSFNTLIPDGIFYTTDPGQEYQFMIRFATRMLSLIDHSDAALVAATQSPIESKFLQPNQSMPSPTLRMQSDAKFIAELTMRCCFSLTTIIGAADYMLRLHAIGAVRLHSTSWKSVFVACCLISEKVWEDNYVHPTHIITQYGYLAKGGSTIPKRDYLRLQIILATALNWDTNTTPARYRDLIMNIMGVSVPYSIFRQLPYGYAGFVPRPLPPQPKMKIPLQTTMRVNNSEYTRSVVLKQHHGSSTSTSAATWIDEHSQSRRAFGSHFYMEE
jgi:hypothetical protein